MFSGKDCLWLYNILPTLRAVLERYRQVASSFPIPLSSGSDFGVPCWEGLKTSSHLISGAVTLLIQIMPWTPRGFVSPASSALRMVHCNPSLWSLMVWMSYRLSSSYHFFIFIWVRVSSGFQLIWPPPYNFADSWLCDCRTWLCTASWGQGGRVGSCFHRILKS